MYKYLLFSLITTAMVLTGCSHSKTASTSQQVGSEQNSAIQPQSKSVAIHEVKVVSPDIYIEQSQQPQVIQTDRYQLTSIDTQKPQKYLLDQFVIVKMQPKKNQKLHVEQGLQFTLDDTGLGLCSSLGQSHLVTLYSRPLPKIHQKFGPMRLRDALQMLAGPAYQLTINEQTRTVCFQIRQTADYDLNQPMSSEKHQEQHHE